MSAASDYEHRDIATESVDAAGESLIDRARRRIQVDIWCKHVGSEL
jgi:hypothetical protein